MIYACSRHMNIYAYGFANSPLEIREGLRLEIRLWGFATSPGIRGWFRLWYRLGIRRFICGFAVSPIDSPLGFRLYSPAISPMKTKPKLENENRLGVSMRKHVDNCPLDDMLQSC